MRLPCRLATLAAGCAVLIGASSAAAPASEPVVLAGSALPSVSTRGSVTGTTTRPGPARRLARRLAGQPVFSVRADGASVGWVTHVRRADGTVDDVVSVYDTEQRRFWVHDQPAVPAFRRLTPRDRSFGVGVPAGLPLPDAGHGAESGRVQALQVLDQGFVAWIANGTTVVVGAQAESDFSLGMIAADPRTGRLVPSSVGADSELRMTGGLAIAGRYPDGPAVRSALSGSLSLRAFGDVDPGMSDVGECEYLTSGVYRWREADGTPRMAQAYVARDRTCRMDAAERRGRR